MLKMTEEELRELLTSWQYEEDAATAYAKRLWANGVRLLSKIANAEKADLAAILAGQEPIALMHNVDASDMIAKAKGECPLTRAKEQASLCYCSRCSSWMQRLSR